jgi:hypothetical protein
VIVNGLSEITIEHCMKKNNKNCVKKNIEKLYEKTNENTVKNNNFFVSKLS